MSLPFLLLRIEDKLTLDEIMDSDELISILGGDQDTGSLNTGPNNPNSLMSMIQSLWDATPDGGNYTFTNNGDGIFSQTDWDPSGDQGTLPPITVSNTGGTVIESYVGSNYSQTNMVFGHTAELAFANGLNDGNTDLAYLLGGLGLRTGPLGALISGALGFLVTAGGSDLSDIIRGITISSGNVEVIISHVWTNVPGASGVSYNFVNVNTGASLGTYSFGS